MVIGFLWIVIGLANCARNRLAKQRFLRTLAGSRDGHMAFELSGRARPGARGRGLPDVPIWLVRMADPIGARAPRTVGEMPLR